jgi:hypothetical protein
MFFEIGCEIMFLLIIEKMELEMGSLSCLYSQKRFIVT